MYRENAAGRLYGVTFIDHNTGVVLNGSHLGKEYAANTIVDRLDNPKQYESTQDVQPTYPTKQHLESSNIGGSIGSFFDIPDDTEEEMFCHQMQHKKKRGRRM